MDRPATLRLGVLHRTFDVRAADVDREKRTVAVSFSSEEPVERWFGREVLSHEPGAVRLGRLNNRGPLLADHDTRDQIGVVEMASVNDRRGRAVLRFSKSAGAEVIWQDVLDGIRSKVSVGYRIHRLKMVEQEGKVSTYRAEDWEPYEISLVSVPADDTVGVGRDAPPDAIDVPIESLSRSDPAMNPSATPPAAAAATTSTGTTTGGSGVTVVVPAAPDPAHPNRYGAAANILAIGRRTGRLEHAADAVQRESSLDDYIRSLADLPAGGAPAPAPGSAAIGMSPREARRFSICRALAGFAVRGGLDGFELEASQAFARKFGLQHGDRSFFIPWEVQQSWGSRDLAAGSGPAGGVTIQTDVLGAELIELLRARLIAGLLGVRTMFGLQGNVSIPLVSTGATGAWLAEAAPITPGQQNFGQVPMTPKRYGASTAYSRQLVVQSTIDVESFVRMDLAETIAHAFDLAIIAGSGAGGQPTGILNTSGIGSVTFGGAAEWADILAFETSVANANADFGALAYLSTPATRGKWKAIPKVAAPANTGGFLWQDSGFVPVLPPAGSPPTPSTPPIGLVNGYRAIASTIVPTNRVIFGNWNDAILGMWIPLEVVVDPYSLALNHQVRVVVNALGDVAVRHAASFCASTDSGAQ